MKSFVYTGLILGLLGAASVRVLGLDEDEEEEAEDEQAEDEAEQPEESLYEGGGKEEDGQIQQSNHKDVVEDNQIDEDAIFVPLGWAKRRPVQPYKGTDPEWQEFMKFAQDHQRGSATRGQ